MNQKWFKVIVTYVGESKETGLWARDIEEAREKAYWKWRNADNREVIETE